MKCPYLFQQATVPYPNQGLTLPVDVLYSGITPFLPVLSGLDMYNVIDILIPINEALWSKNLNKEVWNVKRIQGLCDAGKCC